MNEKELLSLAEFDKFAKSKINPLTNQPYLDGQDMLDTMKNALEDESTRNARASQFDSTIQDLTLLVIRQRISSGVGLSEAQEQVVNVFDSGYIQENGLNLIKDLLTGNSSWEPDAFITDKQTTNKVEAHQIVFYERTIPNGPAVLSKGTYQFRKERTIREIDWVPYLLNGTLNKYMGMVYESLIKTYKTYKFNALAQTITDESNYRYIVNGKAADAYESQNELLQITRKLMYNTNRFNKNKDSKYIYPTKAEDILMFVSPNVEQLRISGVWPQLFNPQKLNGVSFKLSNENFRCLENKLEIGDQDTPIADTNTEWIDDNTIYIIDRTELRHLIMLDKNATQFFAKNITQYIVLHIWGKIDVSPWFKGVIYKNENLTKLPGGSLIQVEFEENPLANPVAVTQKKTKNRK